MCAPIRALVFLAGAALLSAQNLTGVKAIAASGNTSFALLSDGTVWGWGEDDGWEEICGGGQATPVRVSGLTDVVAISPPLALKADGTVWAYWFGATDPSTPIRVNGLTGSVAVAGGWTSLALKSDGTVWEWYGTLAFGVPSTPVRVSGLTEVVAIARLYRHSLAVKRDGTVWEWGDNNNGLPGDGLTTPASTVYGPVLSTPVQVPGLGDVVTVAAGYGHNLALKSDGTVWAWGFNGHGQLGDGTTQTRTTPFQVSGLAGVVKIAAGDAHSVAVKGDGTVWAWGSNVGGQLGDGTTTDRLEPVQVSSLSGTATVAAGRFHNLALKDDGTVWAWGDDQFGQLGDGLQLPTWWQTGPLEPLQVGGLTGVTKIAAGTVHSLAMKSDGTLWAWGDNTSGELGDGQVRAADWPDRSTPVRVSGLSAVAAIAGGDGRSLAVTGDGAVWAWGCNDWDCNVVKPTYTSTPVKVSGLAGVVAIAGRNGQSLAVTGDGAVWAWGSDTGSGGAPYTSTPVPVSGLSGVVSVAAGFSLESYSTADFSYSSATYYHLAVREDGSIWKWGVQRPSSHGRALDPVPVGPVPMAGLTDVVAVAAEGHGLALKRDGTVWAWGNNSWGELGDGTRTERATPVQVAGLSDVAAIDTRGGDMFVGDPHSVALKRDGTVWEWPIYESRYVVPKSLTPVQVAGLTEIVAVAEGGGHSLALRRDGTVWAWGQNISGQLGVRTFAIRTTPVQVVAPAP